MRNRISKRARAIALAGALAASAGIATGPAEAAVSWCGTNAANGECSVFAKVGSNFVYSSGFTNWTPATMICWVDANYYTVNYRSNRWFKVRLNNFNYVAWVHSSEVYYQTTVGRC